MDKIYSVSLVVPAYNEEKNIKDAVLKNRETLKSLNLEYEIIIVDDGSCDKTFQRVSQICKNDDNIKLLRNKTNLGFGGAIKRGIEASNKRYVTYAPCDSPLDKKELTKFLTKMEKCDVAIGYRLRRLGYSKFMLFNSFVYNRILIPLLFNLGLRDVNWIHMYRRDLFKKGLIEIEYDSIFVLAEIVYKAKVKNFIIGEVPTEMKPRIYGKPSSVRIQVIFKTFFDMINFWFRICLEKVR